MTLWLDIDDLLTHLIGFNRPSGIQRVVYEAGAALRRTGGDHVQFLRRGQGPFDFRVIPWETAEEAFRMAMEREQDKPARVETPHQEALHNDNIASDELLLGIGRAQAQAVSAIVQLVFSVARLADSHGLRSGRKALARLSNAPEPASLAGEAVQDTVRFIDWVCPDDVFLTLGAPWHHEDYVRTVRWLRDDVRVRFGLLIHDLVPLRHPEWCDRGVILAFGAWHRAIFPLADAVFTLSKATAQDVSLYLEEQAIVVPMGILLISAGTICNLTAASKTASSIVDGPYILFVSTIEARKNHTLLFRVWRRLILKLPIDEVPTLVFAGREGWLVADLMCQLENTDWLSGKIRLVRSPNDADLHWLYDNCLFTVFPSLFEGWGLPVSESLAMGRPCIASNTTSIPEVGGRLARYFNPHDLNDAYRVIRDVILDRKGLAHWTEAVRTDFKPISWDKSAIAILETFGITRAESLDSSM